MSLSSFNEVFTIVLIVADKVSHWSHSYIFLFAWGLVILRGDPGRQARSTHFSQIHLWTSPKIYPFNLFCLIYTPLNFEVDDVSKTTHQS